MKSPARLRFFSVAAAGLLSLPGVFAAPSEPLRLWPGDAPGETGTIGAEADQSKPGEGGPAGKPIIRLGNVTVPTITVFPAEAGKETGAAVMVCPGGGYGILAYDLEGTEVCERLNQAGVTAILLKYRVPTRPGDDKHLLPLQDAQRALRLIRSHANEWKIDPKRLGILGFSAGGHLAANASAGPRGETYPHVDAADDLSSRPDFTLLIYPAYLTAKDQMDKLAAGLQVDASTPPAFLMQTEDDGVHVENVFAYGAALVKAKVPVELHVYPRGGHGYGLRPMGNNPAGEWPDRAVEWMRGQGYLGAPK